MSSQALKPAPNRAEIIADFGRLPDDAVVRTKTAAAIFDVSPSTLIAWRTRGVLPEPIRLGRTTGYRAGTIRAILGA